MVILHGENLVQSRQKLLELLSTAKEQNREIIRVDAARIQLSELESILGSSDLFGSPKTIVIEELHSLPKSQKKNQLLKLVAEGSQQESTSFELILWEKRELTPTMLKPFINAQVIVSKINNAVFTWLDSLSSQTASKPKQLQLLKQAVASEDAFMCFAMLTRQIRLLIQVSSGSKVAGAPFMVAKLKKQAQHFDLENLLKLHTRLLEVDVAIKTGKSLLNLEQHLDILVIDL